MLWGINVFIVDFISFYNLKETTFFLSILILSSFMRSSLFFFLLSSSSLFDVLSFELVHSLYFWYDLDINLNINGFKSLISIYISLIFW